MYLCRNCDLKLDGNEGSVQALHMRATVPDFWTAPGADLSRNPTFPRTQETCRLCGVTCTHAWFIEASVYGPSDSRHNTIRTCSELSLIHI